MTELDIEQPQLPLVGVGPRLKAAREAAGISRAEIAQKTRISERVIALMEAGDFGALPSRTYATGFTRSYARVLGLEPDGFVTQLRQELLGVQSSTMKNPSDDFEPGDPARVPSARFAWIAAFLALMLIAAGLVFWRNYYLPAMTLPSILPAEVPSAVPAPVASEQPDATLPPEATFTPDSALNPAGPLPTGVPIPSNTGVDPFGLPRGTGLNVDPRAHNPSRPHRTGSAARASAPASDAVPAEASPAPAPAPAPAAGLQP